MVDETPSNDNDELIGFGDWTVDTDYDNEYVVLKVSEVGEDGVRSATVQVPPQSAREIGEALIAHAENFDE